MPKVKLGSKFSGVSGFLDMKKAFDDAMRKNRWEKERQQISERGATNRLGMQLASRKEQAEMTQFPGAYAASGKLGPLEEERALTPEQITEFERRLRLDISKMTPKQKSAIAGIVEQDAASSQDPGYQNFAEGVKAIMSEGEGIDATSLQGLISTGGRYLGRVAELLKGQAAKNLDSGGIGGIWWEGDKPPGYGPKALGVAQEAVGVTPGASAEASGALAKGRTTQPTDLGRMMAEGRSAEVPGYQNIPSIASPGGVQRVANQDYINKKDLYTLDIAYQKLDIDKTTAAAAISVARAESEFKIADFLLKQADTISKIDDRKASAESKADTYALEIKKYNHMIDKAEKSNKLDIAKLLQTQQKQMADVAIKKLTTASTAATYKDTRKLADRILKSISGAQARSIGMEAKPSWEPGRFTSKGFKNVWGDFQGYAGQLRDSQVPLNSIVKQLKKVKSYQLNSGETVKLSSREVDRLVQRLREIYR